MSSDAIDIDGLKVGPCMVRGYRERIAELESDNRRMKKVMQRYIDCQDLSLIHI